MRSTKCAYNEQIKDAKERKDDYSLQERRKKKAGAVRDLQQNEAKLKKYKALEEKYTKNYERDERGREGQGVQRADEDFQPALLF